MPGGTVNPSGLLAESLATLVAGFSKSAHQAFAHVESQARQDVIQAHTDAREARVERDNAIEALHASQLQVQTLQREVADAKAVVSHHKETSAHLRREATQWKDQSLNWQEHFLRVEKEKCALKTTIEELIAERAQWTHPPTPFTPNHPASDDFKPKRRSISTSSRKLPISPPDVDVPAFTILRNHSNRATKKPVRPLKQTETALRQSRYSEDPSISDHAEDRQNDDSPTRANSKTKVIRRVHAIIDVKQESDDEHEQLAAADETVMSSSKRCVPPRKRRALNYDEHDPSDEENTSAFPSDQSYVEEKEEAQDIDEDEDDELMLGADVSDTSLNTRFDLLTVSLGR
ncbi:hypothetical protein H0H92_015364 [Tricholoma furcatifolium]|nr:hypothetical protein H0H92_015364 [Tricholoma furcatifolium]